MFLITLVPVLGILVTVIFYAPTLRSMNQQQPGSAGSSSMLYLCCYSLVGHCYISLACTHAASIVNSLYAPFFRRHGLLPKEPYRFRRGHISHLRLDRLHRLVHEETTTVSVLGASESSVPMRM